MSLRTITPPAQAPVTVEDAKDHIRLALDIDADDDLVGDFIDAATRLTESYANRSWISRTVEMVLDDLSGGEIVLWGQPVVSVTGIWATDVNDVETEIATTVYRASAASGRIVLRRGQVWPTNLAEIDAYRIRYVAGYGEAIEDVPEPARQAIKMQVAEWYENRGEDPEKGVGATATQGVQLALGEAAKGVIRGAGLKRYAL